MLCPKCKKEIDEKFLKCKYCGTKVASVCKECGQINPIRAVECSNCHTPLLKLCKDCGAANLPDANKCRKCGASFTQKKNESVNALEYTSGKTSQQKAKAMLLESIKDGETSIITLCGDSGSGKSLIVRYVINDLKNAKLIWLTGTCTQVTQLSPFGYFQDMLLSFFNINNFCPDTLQLKKNSIKFFKQDFPALSNSEVLDLLNLLYPENLDKYENIYHNKAKMFSIMKKVINTIIEKVKTVFIIDHFENIDGMSYDFLKELLKDEYILERCKFIIISDIDKPGMGLLTSPVLDENNYKDITISLFSSNQVEALISQYRDVNIEPEYIKSASVLSGGNPSVVEQMVMLYKDIKRNKLNLLSYNSLESVMDARLSLLKKEDIKAFRLLCAMSVLGSKFYPAMLENFDNNTPNEFERIIDTLLQKGFINQINNLSFEFKSNDIWNLIVSIIKNEDIFEEILNSLYEILNIYRQSSIALLGFIVQKLNNNDMSFDIWTILMKQASYIGDIGLYIIAQKQCLKLIEHKTSAYYMKIKRNIYARVGKLLEPINYEESFEYLKNAIVMLNENEEYEQMDLLSYLASVSMKKGNYWGVIECAETILEKLPEEMELEVALIKTRKLRPLVCLGNYGQVINIADTEILPVFEKYLTKIKKYDIVGPDELFKYWLEVYFELAEALTMQGDSRMFDIINLLFDIIEKNKITAPEILCKLNLSLAFANTVKGDVMTSEKILDDILKEYSLDSMSSSIVSRWNFIDVINKFQKKDYVTLMSELFNVVAYANNANDNFTKNILKTLLAKILYAKNDTKKALSILDEQVAYFAKEKIATGVLLAWYLISKIRLVTKGTQFALDVATKALDIAKGPKVNNYYFISLFNKLIGEIYIAKQDFESAKVYIEKSIFISKQFGLDKLLVSGYILYAKYYQELAIPKSTLRGNYIKECIKMFHKAKNVPIVSSQNYLQKKIKDELSVLTSFCKINGIVLKKVGG